MQTSEKEGIWEKEIVPEISTLYRVGMFLTRSKYDAEDLVQETLLRAYRSLDRFDGDHPRAWLIAIMKNAHINMNRRRRPIPVEDPSTAGRLEDLVDQDSPEEIVVSNAYDSAVFMALGELKPKLHDVVELVDLNGLSYQEAASALDIPIGTVMSRLHRARDRMRDRVQQLNAEGVA